MKRFVMIMAAMFAITGGVSAFAATQYPPEGGQWNYGVGLGSYSDYMHGQKKHASKVTHSTGSHHSNAYANNWSQARLGNLSGCSFYYNPYGWYNN